MAERLIIVSDMWGTKKGLWITSYLGYLQQYFDITFYDCQQLGNIDIPVQTADSLTSAFEENGQRTAVAHLLKKERKPAYYLGFGIGATIIWEAAKEGLPVTSFYGVSAENITASTDKPDLSDYNLLFGGKDTGKPTEDWCSKTDADIELMPNFGKGLYTDDVIIQKVCLTLLGAVTAMKPKAKKVV